MWSIGPVAFTAPWLLLGLAALPVLWWLLRAVPPAPVRRLFPAVTLLMGLKDDESESDRTPWWLLLLRCLAVAAVIIGFAGPVLNPEETQGGAGPVLILTDASWASASDWRLRQGKIAALVDEAGRAGRPVAVAAVSDPPAGGVEFQSADAWSGRISGLTPAPWAMPATDPGEWIAGLQGGGFDTWWLSDGLARDGRAALLEILRARGTVRVFQSGSERLALRPPVFRDGVIVLEALRSESDGAREATLRAIGPDPAGVERVLAELPVAFGAGEKLATAELSVPAELRNRIRRFEIAGLRSAGAVALTDDALKRRKVGLLAARDDSEGAELLSPLHYLRRALEPTADTVEGTLDDILLSGPDVVVLADVAGLTALESDALEDWVSEGGLLLRFAGPRLAASDVSRAAEDPLMPVRLRAGGRSVGGAMSWGAPKRLRPFAEGTAFHGLDIPDDVTVTSQVMAQPDPSLSGRVIAALADGTPLVTGKTLGQGRVVLFHVAANAEWSTLPLSGLFVQMLERLAVSTRPTQPSAEELDGTTWAPERVLDGFGAERDAGTLPGVPGERLAEGGVGPDLRPGLYASGDRRVAVNVIGDDEMLAPAEWPAGLVVEGMAVQEEARLKGGFLTAALMLLLADIMATLALGGRLARTGRGGAAAALVLALALPGAGEAQQGSDARAVQATSETVLAYVQTGDAALDRISEAGLRGLSRTLTRRTAVEPADPIGVDLEEDELAFFPLLYWPVGAGQPRPSAEAYARLNAYLRTGGMILFDTRDANIAGVGSGSPNGRRLQALAAPLDIPPLEPVPGDHVLTRTFYLLQEFPGRYNGAVWVEAAPPDAARAEGMPFRDLNDGVTPVVIGGNDWAAAWAVDESGQPNFPVGRGFAGERQREFALRFGVNLVMHVLTGNYKSDQVHVPALLDRLGQ
ncbi:LytTR family transcriptional regulator [Maritimibacter sp. 55A14]|uniref:DUF4159 domain-containing protein n=1 Tax=Maritimibacter sp. 55A14 TaxID=2174844 RepID=UPI000D61366B|nr:DUF4159 domain-containing protein [Maritimibacter sp. 55A14]PWE32255.1 LytTR family transcriptional regulator [Maritimibacter sp. 55A14]